MSRLNLKEHLTRLVERFEEIEALLADPRVLADAARFKELSSEHSRRRSHIDQVRHFLDLVRAREESEALLASNEDSEIKELAREEIARVNQELEGREFEMEALLLEPDPNTGRSIIVEIRAGTGGEEAALFASDLFRMYSRFCDRERLTLELLSLSESELGGYKEIIFSIAGPTAWDLLHQEAGAHRVQRIPVTESGGRIHTSAVTVAVLPEAEEDELQVDEKDLRIDVFRASGAGGQHVNKTESAVRITHIPTGLVVSCQDERSQIKNRSKAMKVLRSRLLQLEADARQKEMADLKRSQVKTGDRSERIRTYNFPQGRVTDHRVGVTIYNLGEFMEGDMGEILQALLQNEKKDQLEVLREQQQLMG